MNEWVEITLPFELLQDIYIGNNQRKMKSSETPPGSVNVKSQVLENIKETIKISTLCVLERGL